MDKVLTLSLIALLLIPLTLGLTIENTTFFSSETNFTILVDKIILDAVNVSSTAITFQNLTSFGSNFTNVNQSFPARADFTGLIVGLSVRNINTSANLFTSTVGDQSANLTFQSGEVLQIVNLTVAPSTLQLTCNNLTGGFSTFFGFMPLFFTILAIGLLIFMLGALVFIVMQSSSNKFGSIEKSGVIAILTGLGILGMIGLIFIIMFGSLCSVI